MLGIATELWNAAEDRRRDFVPRVHRGFVYALVRAWTCVVQRDLQIETVIGDIYAGRPVVYTDLLAYDEVAHHSGTERHDTLRVLRRMDRQLARVEAAANGAPRPRAGAARMAPKPNHPRWWSWRQGVSASFTSRGGPGG